MPRIILIIFCALVFVAVLVINALAGAGRGEYSEAQTAVRGFSYAPYSPKVNFSKVSVSVVCVLNMSELLTCPCSVLLIQTAFTGYETAAPRSLPVN